MMVIGEMEERYGPWHQPLLSCGRLSGGLVYFVWHGLAWFSIYLVMVWLWYDKVSLASRMALAWWRVLWRRQLMLWAVR